MNLFQRAVETYDTHSALVGKEIEGHKMLAPISHTLTRPDLEITIDQAGYFLSARLVDKKEPPIPIPVTEKSAGRTAWACPHPLCDQLGYLSTYNKEKHALYVQQLADWESSCYSHPMLLPILTYIKGGTILHDLAQAGLIDLDMNEHTENEKKMVCWRVCGFGTPLDGCWQQPSLFQAFQDWYMSLRAKDEKVLCMITGDYDVPALQHPKGVLPTQPNAKLISSNDKGELVFRGRFTDASQAVTVGYQASQKAHNALRWLVAEQGAKVSFGDRTFLCWNPQGIPVCHVTGAFGVFDKNIVVPSDYRLALKKTLYGYCSLLPEQDEKVVIAALEAVSKGRISITYYNEMAGHDFFQRLHDWDAHCSWYRWYKGIYSPSLLQIINCAFGSVETGKLVTSSGTMREYMQRLVSCRLGECSMPLDIMRALVTNASNPQSYDRAIWQDIVTTACAVIQKYRYDRYKEECDMELDSNRADRSYQFGRLLAIMEKVERDTYSAEDKREPNAIRLMSLFVRRPLYTAAELEKILSQAYFHQLKPAHRSYYRRMIGEIMEQIYGLPEEEWGKPLGETYLMGYYLQRKQLYTSKKNVEYNEEETEV